MVPGADSASTASSLRGLRSFGDVAAEDDAVLDHFLTTEAVRQIEENRVILVLGRKGAGKTALVRHFTEGERADGSIALNLRRYPWAIHASRRDAGASEIEAYAASWRYLIAVQLGALALQLAEGAGLVLPKKGKTAKTAEAKAAGALRQFLQDNYGGAAPALEDTLRPNSLTLSTLSFEPTVLGFKLGAVALDRSSSDLQLGQELDALSSQLLEAASTVATAAGAERLLLHFDELDHGMMRLDDQRREMLIGLVIAAREVRRTFLRGPVAMQPLVYLRSDLWEDLEFSDKNKITASQALALEWSSDSLHALIDARLRSSLGDAARWSKICDDERIRGLSKWDHVLSRTFLRPRDLIRYLNAALDAAQKREPAQLKFKNVDLVAGGAAYSAYLKRELDDEILPHWPHWEEALRAISTISTLRFKRDEFVAAYADKRSPDNEVEADEALRMLHEFSVIGYQARSGYGGSTWVFRYTHPEAGWDHRASQFKVHAGLKQFAKLRD